MKKTAKLFFLFFPFLLFFCSYSPAFAGETITTREIEGYFYADGEMKLSRGQFEITYFIEAKTITRTRVYDFRKKK